MKLSRKDKTINPWIDEFSLAIDAGVNKLSEYYSATGGQVESQYALAAILDPSQKLEIFNTPKWGRTFRNKYQHEFIND